MFSEEQNALLTQTSPGTPMGDMMRRYWLPALLSEEIPDPDGAPVQVRILGERLVAFRDSDGRVGLLDEACSHRGTSLFYGRNEECGLRCVYHGWKYDVDGNVLDTPAEPTVRGGVSPLQRKVKHPAYPTHEAGGIVWAYLGPKEHMPLFPAYAWSQIPQDHVYVTKAYQECNWLQGLEGECDSSHLSFLHREFTSSVQNDAYSADSAPVYEMEETDFGVRLIALRRVGPEKTYVRVSSVVMPNACWIIAGFDKPKENHIYVPIDDTHTWRYDMGWWDRPVTSADVNRAPEIGDGYRRIRNAANHYLIDREMQKQVNYTGIVNFLNHDSMATETMGPIFDRSREHLGLSDRGVITVRRYLLKAVQRFQQGHTPPHVIFDDPHNDLRHVDTLGAIVPSADDWHEHFEHLRLEAPVPVSTARA